MIKAWLYVYRMTFPHAAKAIYIGTRPENQNSNVWKNVKSPLYGELYKEIPGNRYRRTIKRESTTKTQGHILRNGQRNFVFDILWLQRKCILRLTQNSHVENYWRGNLNSKFRFYKLSKTRWSNIQTNCSSRTQITNSKSHSIIGHSVETSMHRG